MWKGSGLRFGYDGPCFGYDGPCCGYVGPCFGLESSCVDLVWIGIGPLLGIEKEYSIEGFGCLVVRVS